jgi:hypothetical protein
MHGVDDALIVRGDHHPIQAAELPRTLGNTADKRFSRKELKGLM